MRNDLYELFECAKQTGQDKWQCRCPAHEDRQASLSITRTHDKWLLYCHAGCSTAAVIAKVGLQMSDLSAKDDFHAQRTKSTEIEYKYHDADGNHVYSAIRKQLPDGGKKFSQRKANGEWNMQGVERVLYNLPEVIRSKLVFIVEGEKDCETLRRHGQCATTNVGGAGKWLQQYCKWLDGKTVYILPDNDEPGKQHARDVREMLGHGTIVELPGLPPKGDVTDWLAKGNTIQDLDALIKSIQSREEGVRRSTLSRASEEYLDSLSRAPRLLFKTGLKAFDAALGGGLEMGDVVMPVARPSHGKTVFGLQICHALASQGLPCLFVNEEMTELKIGRRTLQYVSAIGETEWHQKADDVINDLADHFSERQTIHMVSRCETAQCIATEIREYHAKHGVQAVVVDYLQNIKFDGKRDRYDHVTESSRLLSRLAKELNIIVVLLCQSNRDLEKRSENAKSKATISASLTLAMPRLSDIADSSQIEKDGDVIFFMVWPHKDDPKADQGEYVLFLLKNRDRGISQKITICKFDPVRQRLVDKTMGDFVHSDFKDF